MIRLFLTVLIFSAAIISCSDSTGNADAKEDQQVSAKVKKVKNDQLIYLDNERNISGILCQSWVMEDDADALEGMTEDSKFEIPYRSYYFSADGSFLKNPRNAFDYGTWSFDDATKTITINNTIDKETSIYKIASIAADELILVNTGIGSTTNLKFVAPGLRFKDDADEPFSLKNNRWRIRPKQKETDSAVHQRLKDNMRFFILFYKSVLAKDDKTVSFWGLPSCFKWYGGGIFLKKKEELKDNWIRCFYNEEQAMQAYKIASRLLEEKYEWPKGEQNWLKLNLAVLEQMYMKIDEIR